MVFFNKTNSGNGRVLFSYVNLYTTAAWQGVRFVIVVCPIQQPIPLVRNNKCLWIQWHHRYTDTVTSLLLVSCLRWWCNLRLIYRGLLFCCSLYQTLFFINSCIPNKAGSFWRHYWLIRYDIYLSISVPYIDYFYIGVLN